MARIPVRLAVSLVLAGAGGCDESTTLVLEPNPAVRVVIDTSRCPSVTACSSCTLETDAFDKNSQPAQFPTLLWSSEDRDIATVAALSDGNARVNGWTPGGTTISVEVQESGATDDVHVNVTPAARGIQCQPPGTLGP